MILKRTSLSRRKVLRGAGATLALPLLEAMQIKSFSKTTKDDVVSNLLSLEKENGGKKLDSVVLDVRANPGGYLNAGIDVAKLFLHDGDKIVSVVGKTGIMEAYTVDRERDAKIEFYDNNNQNVVKEMAADRYESIPLYVLVDGKTASASEVMTAALKENNAAKVLGSKTFGKGVIQTIEPVRNGAGVAVTYAKYETPKGNNINKVGIDVDTQITCPIETKSETITTCLP